MGPLGRKRAGRFSPSMDELVVYISSHLPLSSADFSASGFGLRPSHLLQSLSMVF